ncbi:MAG: PhzF family phenazine biosynthesis protein [Halobacteriaceae archaeon]
MDAGDSRDVRIVDAFTTDSLSGNPAGVVPNADDLTDDQMRAVASELGASETAFVRSAPDADRALRFFTPSEEIGLCGHATVATHAHLHAEGAVEAGTHRVATANDEVTVEIEADGTVWLTMDAPTVTAVDADATRVADALGVEAGHVVSDLPLAVADAGLPYLVVGLDYLSTLNGAVPDDGAVAALCESVDATGLYAFTFDTLSADAAAHGRAFLPSVGVSEDPVTGTAAGAAAGYLRWADAYDDWPDELVFEQGHALDRPGRVRARLDGAATVGGRAVTSLTGRVAVPPAEEDDIVEA